MFQYHPDIIEQFPHTVGGVLLARDIRNQATPDTLLATYQAEQLAVIECIGDTPLSEIETLSAWRGVFRAFGLNPTKTRSAPEALLRRLTKKGDIPSINTLVDIGNLVSIRYALPVAIFDTQSLDGTLTVRFADGDEHYTELGSDAVQHPEQREVIFSDESKSVFARRWCWRQSLQSAAKLTTTNAIIVVEAQHEGGRATIEQAQADLQALCEQYAGGTYEASILDKNQLTTS
ncbi:MAG: phenylalanine--tRNA ligase beta subunit-related protein [Chloroflexota bacterium]